MISINTSFIPYKFFNTDKKYIYFTKAHRVLDLNNSQKTPKTWKSILKNSLNKLPQPLKKNQYQNPSNINFTGSSAMKCFSGPCMPATAMKNG